MSEKSEIQNKNEFGRYIKLNVGGYLFTTTLSTLNYGETMLSAMFSGRMAVDQDDSGYYMIDRDGRYFHFILNYLRDGSGIVLPVDIIQIQNIQKEAEFYSIQGLVDMCKHAVNDDSGKNDQLVVPKCSVTVITSQAEETALINQSKKPVIKLLYNRSNNKYSYTNQSDDNMLKNIELFDKLVSRFHGRILFLKDIIGEDICVWSFFGNKRKLSEICCTSIVYATEKKQTKGTGFIMKYAFGYGAYKLSTVRLNQRRHYDNLNMEFVIGIKGKDFVLIGADQSAMRSVIVYQQELDKIHPIGKKTALAVCGEVGDTNFFTEYISKSVALYEIRNGYEMTPDEASAYTRQTLAGSLRSRKPYQVNLMLGGYDTIEDKPRLHMLDYMGSDIECPYGAHGYGAMFTMSILDRHYNKDAPPTREEAVKLYQACADELQRRFMVNLPLFACKIISKDGVETLPTLKANAFK